MKSPFPDPAPGFDDPLAVLAACHGKIQRYSSALAALARGDVDAAQVAGDIRRYFDTAGRHHHQDEECDLFPLLVRHGIDGAALAGEHQRLDALWAACAPELMQLSPSARASALAFAALNEQHVAFENEHVLPAAARLLGPDEIALLGERMALRRGLRR